MNFNERLKKIKYDRRLTNLQIAEMSGVSETAVRKWINGAMPSGDILLRIADELECSTDYLLGRTDNPDVNR